MLTDMSADATGGPEVMFDVPTGMSKMPKPPPTYKRGAGEIYISSCKNIYFHDIFPAQNICFGQGASAFDPRSESSFGGGLSISSLYRRFIVAFSRLRIAYRRCIDDISTMFELNVTVLFIRCRPQYMARGALAMP